MRRQLRISADGYLDLSDRRRVRTPGTKDSSVEPMPEGEALAFLLSHSFPGHRRVVRAMSETDRKGIRLAMWADAISERMAYVDRVWRNITAPVPPPARLDEPELIQVIYYGELRAYPLHLDGEVTRVIPHGGLPAAQAGPRQRVDYGDLELKSA